MTKKTYGGHTFAELRKMGYVRQDDGTWSPTPERLAKMLKDTFNGDEEYRATLVEVRRDEVTGNWVTVDAIRRA